MAQNPEYEAPPRATSNAPMGWTEDLGPVAPASGRWHGGEYWGSPTRLSNGHRYRCRPGLPGRHPHWRSPIPGGLAAEVAPGDSYGLTDGAFRGGSDANWSLGADPAANRERQPRGPDIRVCPRNSCHRSARGLRSVIRGELDEFASRDQPRVPKRGSTRRGG
jgi:hypothetical protein